MKTLMFAILLLAYSLCNAQPTAPVLRLETGMHTAGANKISTDAAGKYLLTCSDDKTARLWDAATGQLLNTLRIPIGGTDEGKLYACALSPDGMIAAVGGWKGEWDKYECIYLVHTQTGRIVYRIKGLPNVVLDLEFSSDGKWLAAGLGGSNGMRLYDTRNWAEVKKMEGYKGEVYSVSFDKNNRLATVCYDGKLRLYNNQFELKLVQSNLPGKQPSNIVFNPSGTLLAVVYSDVETVEVRSGTDLSLLYKPLITNIEAVDRMFYTLAFSNDGLILHGGGSYQQPDGKGTWKIVLRSWDSAGKGSYTDKLVMQNSIVDVKTLPDGNLALTGFQPDIAVIAKSGNIIWYKTVSSNDYRANDKSNLRINHTGSAIGVTPLYETPFSYDLAGRSLKQENSIYPSYTDKNVGIEVTNWKNSYSPSINSKPVTFLGKFEKSTCTDITSNNKEIILGTTWNLYKTNADGAMLWKTPLPAVAWVVNISGNDKTVIAALGDGTLRWYSMADGKELLTFYLTNDKKRWVLFTPSGYYDASPGAEELLGWHVNNGPDEAPSFYPVSRFREQYYRPDIIDAVLETYNEEQAITLANSRSTKKTVADAVNIKEKLPPVLTITSPLNGSAVSSETVKINYSLKTPGDAPVKTIKALVNGRPVAVERGVTVLPSNNYTISISIPPADCTVTLLAENDNGTSPEANLYLKFKVPDKPREEFVKKPKLYVLAIGISQYQNAGYNLNYAASDATGLIAALRQQKGGLYEDVIVKPLINAAATRENIQDGLQWIQDQTTQQDVAMLFFAGHGMNDNSGIFYMLPVAADINRLRSTCLNFEELKQTVSNIAGKVVVFIDACHSGNVMGSGQRSVADINALVNELSSTQNGAITFTSSTGKEYSLEDAAWQHGAFTKALLEGLNGKAAVPGKNKITVKSLDAYISERVKELTKGKQHPTSVVPPNVPDFPIAVGE